MAPIGFCAPAFPGALRPAIFSATQPLRPIRGVPARRTLRASAAASALSARGQELLTTYLSAPLYRAPWGASPSETAAVISGAGAGPDAFVAQFDEMVRAARASIEREYPGIASPGGALYPPLRADACWRDLRQFLALAAGVAYCGGDVRPDALPVLREMYREMEVPLMPMRAGLFALKGEAMKKGAPAAAGAALDVVAQALA